jgi:hypothetical protein
MLRVGNVNPETESPACPNEVWHCHRELQTVSLDYLDNEQEFRVRAIGWSVRDMTLGAKCHSFVGRQSTEIRVVSRRPSALSSEMTLRLCSFIVWSEPT